MSFTLAAPKEYLQKTSFKTRIGYLFGVARKKERVAFRKECVKFDF